MFKKIILAALVVTSAVFAQINVGGHAAFNFGTVWGDHTEDAGFGAGFNAGVNAKVGFSEAVALVPGLELEYRRVAASSKNDDETFTFMYLDVPVLGQFRVAPNFFIDAGVALGINLSSSVTDGDVSVDVPDDYKTTIEFGILAGVGFTVIPNLDLNLRFELGLTDMLDTKVSGSKNMRLQAGATYWFM